MAVLEILQSSGGIGTASGLRILNKPYKEICMKNLTHEVSAFHAHTARMKPQAVEEITLVLETYPGGPIRSVPKGLYDRLLPQIQARIPELICGVKYKAEELCTSSFWDEIDESDHTTAGKCIAIMVTRGELPLLAAGKDDRNACLYEVP